MKICKTCRVCGTKYTQLGNPGCDCRKQPAFPEGRYNQNTRDGSIPVGDEQDSNPRVRTRSVFLPLREHHSPVQFRSKLTRRRSLELCRDLWRWLARNPRREKYDWPGWNRYGTVPAYCPCCGYVIQRYGKDKLYPACVRRCPLGLLWPKGCSAKGSPFARWLLSRIHRVRRCCAEQIADACCRELSALKPRARK